MNSARHPVLTIGHSTHPLTAFVELLKANSVAAVADVRSAPFSRFSPQFNRDILEKSLLADGIRYVFLGRELGGRSDDPACYENGRIQYRRLACTTPFRVGIERVIRGAGRQCIALMCAEKEPLDCHRTLLVAPALVNAGIVVNHILADGRVEPHEATMDRLLDLVAVPRKDLFRSKGELIEEAVLRHAGRIAYVDETLAGPEPRKTL
jgi:uncharacterized protein (DUF488 family)